MKILKIEVKTKQLAKIKKFYGDLLNFTITDDSKERMVLQAGTTTIIFHQDDESEAYYHIAFSIPSDQLSESKKWLQGKGIDLITKDQQDQFEFKDWPATACYFYDPDGNLIEFIAHHSIASENPHSFNQNHILCVSEIGLPVENVSEAIQKIGDTFHLSLWRGDGEQFAAIGDENGLFIVIDTKRLWFPDNRKAGMFATSVTIEGNSKEKLQLGRQLYLLNSELL